MANEIRLQRPESSGLVCLGNAFGRIATDQVILCDHLSNVCGASFRVPAICL